VTAIPPEVPSNDSTALLVGMTRLEAKVDVVLAQHGAKIDAHASDLQDHEERLRVLEARPTVSPRVLWTTVASIITALAAVLGSIALFL
jgi:hypothetical protein